MTRVLAHSQEHDQTLAEALRELRRSSTRGWVRDLARRLGRRGGDDLGVLADRPGPAPPSDAAPELRLGEIFADVEARLLAASRPSKRRRRKVVWGIYLRSLLDGVLLTRAEVVAVARELGLRAAKASDRQIERDLSLLVAELRASAPGT